MRRIFPTHLFVLLITLGSAEASFPTDAVNEVAALLNAWDLPAADLKLAPLVRDHADEPEVMYLRGRRAFLRSRYEDAVNYLNEAAALRPRDARLRSTLELYKSTRDTVQDFKTVQTSGGHFVIAYRPGVDEVLIPYAEEALERAYVTLGETFGYLPPEPVRVEIYPQVTDLAHVSPLKASEIRTSGTIALCKYNRLMIVSPRALVYGYRWLDTLAHEYIHLLITRRSQNRVPIWLHEGMAKFFENRWRETSNATLEPVSEDLLARALHERRLIRFEAMSPSMAKLPSQEDTALAFAEVFMVMEMLYERGGEEAVNRIIDSLRDGLTDQEAIERVAQKSFRRFQREWRNYLYQRNLRRLPTHANSRLLFRDSADATDELSDIPHEQARNLAYLGDRLMARRRFLAASREYSKAIELVGGPNPLLTGKLASALLKQGQHRRVIQVITPALRLNPGHVLLYLYRGKAQLAVGAYEAGLEDLLHAVRINPFDPEVHGLLAQAFSNLGRDAEAAMERRHHQLVGTR